MLPADFSSQWSQRRLLGIYTPIKPNVYFSSQHDLCPFLIHHLHSYISTAMPVNERKRSVSFADTVTNQAPTAASEQGEAPSWTSAIHDKPLEADQEVQAGLSQ
jgi:hypothetical protein